MWSPTQLSSLFDVGSAKRVLKAQWQDTGVPFYRGREVTKLSQQGYVENDLFITEELYAEYKDKYDVPSTGDIMITAIGTIGNSYIVQDEDKFYYKDASVLCLKKISDVDSKFIDYWLKSSHMKSQLDEGNGATVDTLTIKKMKSLTVNLPTLDEQKRIVAILDEAFAGIDQAIKNTEKNLANAKELFESYLNNIFTQKGEGWVEKKIGDIADVKGGKRVPKGYKLTTEPTDHPYIAVKDFTDGGSVSMNKLKYITNEIYDLISRYIISCDDVYISIAGTIGKTGIIPEELDGANLTENACKLVIKEGVDKKFIYYFTKTSSFKDQATKGTRTAAQPKLALSRIKLIKLLLPLIEKQNKIVNLCSEISNDTQALMVTNKQKLSALKELKQSLLQKAFAGEISSDMREVA